MNGRFLITLDWVTPKLKNMQEENPKHRLKTISKEEARETYKKQKEHWNYYNEREFSEELFNQRFNFLLITYSIFIAAVFSVKD